MFHGSYLKSDVEFLVKVVEMDFTDIREKEQSIQSKKAHYSEMLSKEYEPSKEYLEMFYQSYHLNKTRFAQDILHLSYHLSLKKEIVLISLLRAGTPIGVLLKRTLKAQFNQEIKHYAISIIRDREIDTKALHYILKQHPSKEFIFIDGWTGKGVINQALKKFIQHFNKTYHTKVSDRLYVISDIAYSADFSVSNEDYLLPSSALNSTISGLVSRSILNKKLIKEGDFHGCHYYVNYAKSDLTLWFVDAISKEIASLKQTHKPLMTQNIQKHQAIQGYLKNIQKKFKITSMNYIKPGIAESTRVLLRRIPYLILVQDKADKSLKHLLLLAKEKQVEVIEDSQLPYRALAMIKDIL